MSEQYVIVVRTNGQVQFVYSDMLQAMFECGVIDIKRASGVEPTKDAKWVADMSPVGGPILGPFNLRSEALKAEGEWLQTNYLL